MSKKPFSESQAEEPHASLFENEEITNIEDWLLNLFLSEKLGRTEAANTLNLAKNLLISGILPDVQEVHLRSEEKGAGFENFVEFRTDFGWIRLRDLGYGYQTMIAWVLDLVKRMVERYPNLRNPLTQPAIVLVDEIDLHLHPDWQRRIIAHLTKYFPNTQFVVTAHSPLIVQSAEEINLVILKKEGESVHIEQPKIRTFRGWTVEEILTDLMALEGQTMSQTYLDLMQQFDDALDADDYEKAEAAYKELDKILHPNSHQRKLLQLQMTSLSPADAV
jgi:predicted ATP-binding protein involved in virulence